MKWIKILSLILCAVLLLGACGAGKECESADTFIENLRVGWNLGDSLSVYDEESAGDPGESYEAVCDFETSWNNPVTTEEMIHAVCGRGFNAIRIQVSFYNHMDEEGNISEAFLDRLEEVVGYGLDAGAYVVINVTGFAWLSTEPTLAETNGAILENIWKQVAGRFRDTGEKLIFECFNEILDKGESWNGTSAADYAVVNRFYQLFVDTVRASGGYNKSRNLMLNPYAGTYEKDVIGKMVLPHDPAEGHLILQVHCYHPIDFTFDEINLGNSNFSWTWGNGNQKEQLDWIFADVKEAADELGVPVVIGEFGVCDRTEESERAEYVGYYAEAAAKQGIKVFLFDDGNGLRVFDRANLDWLYPSVVDALFEGIE